MTRRIGLAIAWLWAAGWVVLGAMFGTGGLEGREAVVGAIMQAFIPGALFVALALVVSLWRRAGAIALMLVGLAIGAAYPLKAPGESMSAVAFIELTMALPPIVAGALLLAAPNRDRSVAARSG